MKGEKKNLFINISASISSSIKTSQCQKFKLGLFRWRKKNPFLLIAALVRLYLDNLGFNLDLIGPVASSVEKTVVMFSEPSDKQTVRNS